MGLFETAWSHLEADGRRVALGYIRRYRLSVTPEELVHETAAAMLRHDQRGTPVDDAVPYTNRVMRNLAVGLVRGERRRIEGRADLVYLDAEPADDGVPFELAGGSEPDAAVLARLDLAGLREALRGQLDERPLEAAGALAVLAHVDPAGAASPADDCPTPRGGAAPTEAAAWVGLFYAGRRNCWPVGGDDTPAIRKRRSRYAAAQTAVLHQAAAEQGLHAGGDRG